MDTNFTQGIIGYGISPTGKAMTFARYELGQEPSEIDYWRDVSPEDRVLACEQLRQLAYGYDPATLRMERVFQHIEFRES